MDDIYGYLKNDHQKVAKLFDLYETSPSERNKLEIVAMLNRELTAHAISEEKTFYKALEAHEVNHEDIQHAEKEHQEIKDKLAEIKDLTHADKKLDTKIQELRKIVEHHVSEEEGKIFKEAKNVLSKVEAYVLKEQMHYQKGKLLVKKLTNELQTELVD